MRFQSLTRLIAPATEPVTLEEAKVFLRIEQDQENTLIEGLIKAARAVAEAHLRRSLITQSWRCALQPVTATYLPLPKSPVQSVTQVAFMDSEGAQEIVPPARYRLQDKETLQLDVSPDHARIEIEYDAGYGDTPNDVPEPIRQGILMHVVALYEQRTGGNALPEAVVGLYAPFREMRV